VLWQGGWWPGTVITHFGDVPMDVVVAVAIDDGPIVLRHFWDCSTDA
jgi:hypothetical protein